MAVHRIQGLLFILFGIVASLDSWRITESVRPTANFDTIGPDRYLAILSALMILLGLGLALRPKSAGQAGDWGDLCKWPPADYLIVTVILVAYIWLISVIGFAISSLLFFVALFRLLGEWSWARTLSYAVITTVCLYVVFIYLADMSLPTSFLGI